MSTREEFVAACEAALEQLPEGEEMILIAMVPNPDKLEIRFSGTLEDAALLATLEECVRRLRGGRQLCPPSQN